MHRVNGVSFKYLVPSSNVADNTVNHIYRRWAASRNETTGVS